MSSLVDDLGSVHYCDKIHRTLSLNQDVSMPPRVRFMTLLGLLTVLCQIPPGVSQTMIDSVNHSRINALRVFLDCNRCDYNYLKREITFINYMRDPLDSDLHILVTTQRTASEGREYTLYFIGQNDFANMQDTLTYVTHQTDTDDEIRSGLAHSLKLGLIRFVARTPIADQLSISYFEGVPLEPIVDKWNYWVFRSNLNSFFDGEESTSIFNIRGQVRATRITANWKIRSIGNMRYREESYSTSEGKTKYITRDYGLNTLIVKSFGDHWSFGGRAFVSTSTYNNTKFSAGIAPAVEFNYFPYSESSRRELRMNYSINFNSFKYQEITIFDKTSEKLFQQSLDITFRLRQPWGTAETFVDASNYLHDFDLNRIRFGGELEVRLFKGFALDLYGRISNIRDQITLPKAEASDEDILLGRIQLPTSFEYYGSIGISYTFGSIYANVVNSRFGN